MPGRIRGSGANHTSIVHVAELLLTTQTEQAQLLVDGSAYHGSTHIAARRDRSIRSLISNASSIKRPAPQASAMHCAARHSTQHPCAAPRFALSSHADVRLRWFRAETQRTCRFCTTTPPPPTAIGNGDILSSRAAQCTGSMDDAPT